MNWLKNKCTLYSCVILTNWNMQVLGSFHVGVWFRQCDSGVSILCLDVQRRLSGRASAQQRALLDASLAQDDPPARNSRSHPRSAHQSTHRGDPLSGRDRLVQWPASISAQQRPLLKSTRAESHFPPWHHPDPPHMCASHAALTTTEIQSPAKKISTAPSVKECQDVSSLKHANHIKYGCLCWEPCRFGKNKVSCF